MGKSEHLKPAALYARVSSDRQDVISPQRQYQCSYASATLRSGELLSSLCLLAVLHLRRERGRPSSRCLATEASDLARRWW